MNSTLSDIASAITASIASDGQTTPTANLPMANHKLTGLATGSTAGDSLSFNGALGTPSSGTLTNATGLPAAGVVGTALVAAAIGTTVQAYGANLTTWAAITPGTGVDAALAVNVGTGGAFLTADAIQPISASVGANALTISASNLSLNFRSATLTSGTVTTVVGTPTNLVISSGSTLGTVSAIQSRIVVLALNNAGTIELAAVNMSGGVDISETGVISTTAEGGAGAADSATVVYSATARTGVAYRVIGYVESTQATAGTWATSPSTIQGAGGNALASMSSLGYGQTWQSVTRTSGVTYYNTTGKPIMLKFEATATTSAANVVVGINIGGVAIGSVTGGAVSVAFATCSGIIIPTGQSYVLTDTNVAARPTFELR